MTQTCIRCGAPKENDEKQCKKCGSSNFTAPTNSPAVKITPIKTEKKDNPPSKTEVVKDESLVHFSSQGNMEKFNTTQPDEYSKKFEQPIEQRPIIIKEEFPPKNDEPQVNSVYLEKLNRIMKGKGITFKNEEDLINFLAETPEEIQIIEKPSITIIEKETKTSEKYPKFVKDAIFLSNNLLKFPKKEQFSQKMSFEPETIEIDNITLPPGDALRDIKEEIKVNQFIGLITLVLLVILIVVIAFTFQ